jgi:hypothetical protein
MRAAAAIAERAGGRRLAGLGAPWGVAPVLVGVVTMALGVLLRAPTFSYHGRRAQDPFNAYIFHHVWAYSDVASLYFRDQLWFHPLQYVDYRFEYPVLTGAFVWLASFVHGSVGAYLLVTAAALMGCGVLILWLIARFPGGNPWLLALAPALALYVVLNWDLLALAATVGAVVLYQRRRDATASVVLAAGTWLKFFPLLLLPIVVAQRLAQRRVRDAVVAVATFSAVSLALNLPVALKVGPHGLAVRDGWKWFFTYNSQRDAGASLWTLIPHVHLAISTVNALSAGLTALGLLAVMLAMARTGGGAETGAGAVPEAGRGTETATGTGGGGRQRSPLPIGLVAIVAWFFFVNKVYSPQYGLWVVALLALAGAPTALVVAFAGVDVFGYMASFMTLNLATNHPAAFADFNAQVHKPAIALRELALLAVVAWSASRLVGLGRPRAPAPEPAAAQVLSSSSIR